MDFGIIFFSIFVPNSKLFWIFKTDFIFIKNLLKNSFIGSRVFGDNANFCVKLILNVSLESISLTNLLLSAWNVDILSISCINICVTLNELIHLLSIILLGGVLLSRCSSFHLVFQILFEHHNFIFSVSKLEIVIVWHVQPWVFEHLLGGCSCLVIPRKHWEQEISELLGLLFFDSVLFNQNLLKWPIIKT